MQAPAAISADQADTFARIELQVDMIEQCVMPKSKTNFFKGKQRHKTVAGFSVFGKEPLNKRNTPRRTTCSKIPE